MLRALGELELSGIATTVPAHLAIVSHPDFAEARHSSNWVEERLDLSTLGQDIANETVTGDAGTDETEPKVLRQVTAEVDGRRYEVKLWLPDAAATSTDTVRGGTRSPKPHSAMTGTGSGTVAVLMQGTIVKVLVAPGDEVEVGQSVCVLEAMKMENAITAEKAGTVKEVRVSAGDSVGPGDVVAVID